MLDIRQTRTYAKYLRRRGWNVKEINHVNIFIKRLPFIGSFIKIQRPKVINYEKIKKLAKKQDASQIAIEPKNDLDAKHVESLGFKKSKSPYLPTKTVLLDLTQSKQQILDDFRKETKRLVEKTARLEIKEEENIKKFRNVWKKETSLKRYVPSLDSLKNLKGVFKTEALFLISEDSSAGAIFLKSNGMAYYWQAFAGGVARKNKSQYQIVWKGIVWAKERGSKIFDFEGIYDERFPNEKWKGFSFFKKGFGGEEKLYPGAFKKLVAIL